MDNQKLSLLYLDGEVILDGEYILNGYTDYQDFEFYPVRLQIIGEFKPEAGLSGQIHPVLNVPLFVNADPIVRISSIFYPRYSPPAIYLNGEMGLNGEYTLNGCVESDDIPTLFLNGEADMNGEYMLNGYMNNQNLGFYPFNMWIKGSCRQRTELLGQSHFVVDTRLSAKSAMSLMRQSAPIKIVSDLEDVIRVSGSVKEAVSSGKERLVVENDLWFLDGNQSLDGKVFLDADVYEIVL